MFYSITRTPRYKKKIHQSISGIFPNLFVLILVNVLLTKRKYISIICNNIHNIRYYLVFPRSCIAVYNSIIFKFESLFIRK